jgi:hypothetical protein
MGQGIWNNTNWDSPGSDFVPKKGKRYSVGSDDSVGIILTNVEGSTSGLAYVKGNGECYWNSDTNRNENRNTKILSSKDGAIFDINDEALITKVTLWTWYEYVYIGHGFETSVTYNGAFANISGNATFMYGHTWEEVTINGISIAGGFGVNWSSSSGAWDVQSADQLF